MPDTWTLQPYLVRLRGKRFVNTKIAIYLMILIRNHVQILKIRLVEVVHSRNMITHVASNPVCCAHIIGIFSRNNARGQEILPHGIVCVIRQ